MTEATTIHNRGVSQHYELLERYTAGIALAGYEVKAIKSGRGSLAGSYVTVQTSPERSRRGNELWLIGCSIPPYQPKNAPKEYNEERPRKLLLKRDEIKYLIGKTKERGLTLIPLKIFVLRNLIKVELALAKGLKKYEKREKLKKREFERERERAIKS